MTGSPSLNPAPPMGRRKKPDQHHRLLATPKPRAVIRFVLVELVKGSSRGRDKELSGGEKSEHHPTAFSSVPIRAARLRSRFGSFVSEARGPADRALS